MVNENATPISNESAPAPVETPAPVEITESASEPVQTEESASTDSVTEQPAVKKERLFSEGKMASIVTAQVRKAKEEAKAEAKAEMMAEMQSRMFPQQQQQAAEQPVAYTQAQIAQLQQHALREYEVNSIESSFTSKIQDKPEVIAAMRDLGFDKFDRNQEFDVNFVRNLNTIDNVADVMLQLRKEPADFTKLLSLHGLNPKFSLEHLQKISNSIKQNQDALAKDRASAPPEPLKASSYGLGSGDSSISEMRKRKEFLF